MELHGIHTVVFRTVRHGMRCKTFLLIDFLLSLWGGIYGILGRELEVGNKYSNIFGILAFRNMMVSCYWRLAGDGLRGVCSSGM